jgi:hypothetical protein
VGVKGEGGCRVNISSRGERTERVRRKFGQNNSVEMALNLRDNIMGMEKKKKNER